MLKNIITKNSDLDTKFVPRVVRSVEISIIYQKNYCLLVQLLVYLTQIY